MKVKKMILGIGLILLGIAIDQITKYIAIVQLRDQPSVPVIKSFFELTYVENTGGAWGALGGHLWLFITVTIIALGIFAYLMKDFNLQTHPFYSISLILIITGTIGNFIDRLFRGFVVDFLNFYIFGYDFPVFNFADMCLTVGVGILLVDIIFGKSGHLLG